MPKRVRTGLTRSDILDRYVERFKQQLVKFQPFLSRKRGSASLEDFDEAAEELIAQVFGAASDESEAYFFRERLENPYFLPEEAQESGTLQCGTSGSSATTTSAGELLGRSGVASPVAGHEEGKRERIRRWSKSTCRTRFGASIKKRQSNKQDKFCRSIRSVH